MGRVWDCKSSPGASSGAAGSRPDLGCVACLDSWCPSAGSCLGARSDSLAGPGLAPDPTRGQLRLGALVLLPESCAAVLQAAAWWRCGSTGRGRCVCRRLGARLPGNPRRLAVPGLWGAAPPPSPPASFPGSTKPLLSAQGLPTDYPLGKKLGSLALFSLLGLAMQRTLATDFILLKPSFFLVFICLCACTTFLRSHQ